MANDVKVRLMRCATQNDSLTAMIVEARKTEQLMRDKNKEQRLKIDDLVIAYNKEHDLTNLARQDATKQRRLKNGTILGSAVVVVAVLLFK